MQLHGPDGESRYIAFGPFLLWPGRSQLLEGGVPARVGDRALRILTALVERAGETVSKRELMAWLWPGSMTAECNLKLNMGALRRVLGDDPGTARYIATVSEVGYRFVAPVRIGRVEGPASWRATDAAPSHNLPFARTRIFGRADEIDLVRRDLDETRLVSIVGSSGVGKTTLALAVAEQAIGSLKDGVWLVEMAPIDDPDLVPSAIAMAIGLAANAADLLAALCDHLRGRNTLLVLDGCDHVASAAARCVAGLLANTQGVRLLVTSREPLLLGGEQIRWLPGLGSPASSAQLSADEAHLFPAIQLFVDRATDTVESFALSDADAPAVADICRRLEGHALALALTASRIDAFGVDDLLQQLAERVGTRSRILPETLAWTCELLLPHQRRLLCAVSVFPGIFDVEGAAAVSGLPLIETASALSELLARSLLAVDIDGAVLTYHLLEITRRHCLERLHTSGGASDARRRHAVHVCAVLERATAEWAWRRAGAWGARYGRFVHDLRAALASCGVDATGRPLRIRLSVAGLRLWDHFALTEECRRQVSQAIDDIDAAGLAGSADEMQLKAWLAGAMVVTRGFIPPAMAAMRRALEIANRVGNTGCRLHCLRMIGRYELATGEHEAGRRTLGAFAFLAAAHDPSAVTEGEAQLATAEFLLGHQSSSARQHLPQPLWLTGSPDTAMRVAAAAAHRPSDNEHHLSMNDALSHACQVFYWSGRTAACRRYVGMLDAHVTRHGFLFRRPVAMFYRAALACARGEAPSDAALCALEQAIAEFHAFHLLAQLPYHLCVLAEGQAKCGRLADAETTIGAALKRASATQERWCVPELLRVQAAIRTATGQIDEAEALLRESMAMAKHIGAMSWRLRAANDLAQLWRAGARAREARELLHPVYNEFLEGFGTRDLVRTACLLASLPSPPGTK